MRLSRVLTTPTGLFLGHQRAERLHRLHPKETLFASTVSQAARGHRGRPVNRHVLHTLETENVDKDGAHYT